MWFYLSRWRFMIASQLPVLPHSILLSLPFLIEHLLALPTYSFSFWAFAHAVDYSWDTLRYVYLFNFKLYSSFNLDATFSKVFSNFPDCPHFSYFLHLSRLLEPLIHLSLQSSILWKIVSSIKPRTISILIIPVSLA